MLALVAALKPIVSKISELTREIAHRVRAHPDGHIFLSLFKDPKSVVCAAALLAEIGDYRARYRTAEALAADAGMSPVAVESGKRKVATFAGAATTASERPSRRSPTRPATGTPGRKTATRPPEPVAKTTNARSAPSDAPGSASSGAAGKTVPPTTPRATAACKTTSRSSFPTGPGPAWT